MWMRDRGIKGASKLNVSELKEKLGELMNRAGGPPPVLGPKGGPIHHMEDLIVSFHSVMSNLMTDFVDQCVVRTVDMEIKIFLSVLDQIDSSLREVGDDPIWITSSNCINLLNLPDILEKFGPMRYLWEGSMQGEGIIKHLRPFVHGMKNNWHVNALTSFCRHRSLLMMKHDDTSIGDRVLGYRNTDKCRKYKCSEACSEALLQHRPLSAVQFSNGMLGMLLTKDIFVELHVNNYLHTHFSQAYFTVSIDTTKHRAVTKPGDIVFHLLFLPDIDLETGMMSKNSAYCILRDDWTSLFNNRRFGRQRFEPAKPIRS